MQILLLCTRARSPAKGLHHNAPDKGGSLMTYIPSPTRYDGMTYRRCGRSGLLLPAISLGLWPNFGDITPFGTQRDILRTALMNLTFNGSFATMPVRIAMRKFPLTIVRPLALIAEDELRQWAACQGYRPVDKVCPHDKESNRTHVEQLTDAMQRLNPVYRHHLWHALLKAGALVEE